MLCSKCKIKETDSTSGWCWWCINNATIDFDTWEQKKSATNGFKNGIPKYVLYENLTP